MSIYNRWIVGSIVEIHIQPYLQQPSSGVWPDVFAVMQHRENASEQTDDLQNLSACVAASGAVLAITAEPSEEVMNEIEQFCNADTELSPRVAKEIIFRRIWYRLLHDC